MFISDASQWASSLLASCELGDVRRRKRLVTYMADQARHAGSATATACEGDKARCLGAYRLLHNQQVDVEAIAEAAFSYALEQAQEARELLAIEDTTSLGFTHSLRSELGDIGSHFGKLTARGYQVHSVLLLNANDGYLYGLVEQNRRKRDQRKRGQRHTRRKRAYREKESYKWEQATIALRQRLAQFGLCKRVLWVADREADIYEYLQAKHEAKERFLVRAAQNRLLLDEPLKLNELLSKSSVLGAYETEIKQRQGRKARTVRLELRSTHCTLKPTSRRGNAQQQKLHPLPIWALQAQEVAPVKQPLCWTLLSSEPIETYDQAVRLLRFYQRRWQIEEFHKVWKSGCNVEKRRLQNSDALERLCVILALIAVRILQLQHCSKSRPQTPCNVVFSDTAWKVLWVSTMDISLPQKVPELQWAYLALAKLGGWYDSKRTGKVGWQTLWKGWQRLNERIDTWLLAQKHIPKM